MVAQSLTDRFTSNVFVGDDQTLHGTNREKLNRRKASAGMDTPALNIAASKMRAIDMTSSAAVTAIDLNFLLNISRKLHGPLQQITAPLEMLQSTDDRLSERERKQLYSLIGLHTSQILDLVNQLLQTRQIPVPAEPVTTPQAASTAFSAPGTTPTGRRCSNYDTELLEKLYKIMEENLEETGFNVHKMCSMMHLSHMHLIRKVKQLTGKKPIDLLKSYRLKRAKELLSKNNLSVAEVAYKIGYDMPNSFSRAFRKEFGISPSEYID